MAIKKVIEIDVDELKALGGLENLAKALDKVDDSAKDVDKTFEQVYGDLKPLTARMGEAEDRLYELALAGKSTSKEYKELLASVSNYRKTQIDVDRVVDASASTLDLKLGGALQGVTSSFAGVQGAMALMGGQSEGLEKTLVKVQGAMALAEGVRGIREGVDSFKALGASAMRYSIVQKIVTAGQYLWNLAMSLNPIGLLVTAIASLIAGGVLLTNYFRDNAKMSAINTAKVKENADALANQTKELEKNSIAFGKKQSQEIAMAKASGKSVEAIRLLELKLIDERIAYEKSQRAIAQNTYQKNQNTLASLRSMGADEELIKQQLETTNEAIKEYNKQNQNVQKSFDERIDIKNRHLVEIKSIETDANNKAIEKDKSESLKASEKAKSDGEKAKEEAKQLEKEKIEAIESIRVGRIDTEAERREEELYQVRLQYQKLNEEALKFGLDTAGLKEAERTKIKEIEIKNAEEDEAKELEYWANESDKAIARDEAKNTSDKKRADDEVLIQKQKDDAIAMSKQNLNNIIGGLEASGLAKTKAGQIVSKAIALTQIGIDSAVAMSKASTLATAEGVALQLAFPTVPGIGAIGRVLSYTATALSVVSNISRAKKLLSGGGGGGGATPSGGGATPSGGLSGRGPSSVAPSFNVVGNAGVNQIEQTLSSNQPIQAYVVSGNVTTAQSLDRNIITNASMG